MNKALKTVSIALILALTAAVSAAPIKWTLSLTDSNTLKGIKDTLLPDGDNYKEGSVNVIWTRLN